MKDHELLRQALDIAVGRLLEAGDYDAVKKIEAILCQINREEGSES